MPLILGTDVAWQLGRAAIIDRFTAIIAVVSAIALLRFRINAASLIGATTL